MTLRQLTDWNGKPIVVDEADIVAGVDLGASSDFAILHVSPSCQSFTRRLREIEPTSVSFSDKASK